MKKIKSYSEFTGILETNKTILKFEQFEKIEPAKEKQDQREPKSQPSA